MNIVNETTIDTIGRQFHFHYIILLVVLVEVIANTAYFFGVRVCVFNAHLDEIAAFVRFS